MLQLSGKYLANLRELCLAEMVSLHHQKKPYLAIVQVGDLEASNLYITKKMEAANRCNIITSLFKLDENTSNDELKNRLSEIACNPSVDAVIVQLPLPERVSLSSLDVIPALKDIDCLSTSNLGALFKGAPVHIPCTPSACLKLLDLYFLLKRQEKYIADPPLVDLAGLTCLVVGRSNLVGKPLAHLLLQRNATVIQAHSKTQNLPYLASISDCVFLAAGKPRFFKASWCKKGSVVFDIGISVLGKKLVGDLDLDSDRLGAYTPVPGGVGPMTVQMLLENVYKAFKSGQNSAVNRFS